MWETRNGTVRAKDPRNAEAAACVRPGRKPKLTSCTATTTYQRTRTQYKELGRRRQTIFCPNPFYKSSAIVLNKIHRSARDMADFLFCLRVYVHTTAAHARTLYYVHGTMASHSNGRNIGNNSHEWLSGGRHTPVFLIDSVLYTGNFWEICEKKKKEKNRLKLKSKQFLSI